jgi:hypothetical protein
VQHGERQAKPAGERKKNDHRSASRALNAIVSAIKATASTVHLARNVQNTEWNADREMQCIACMRNVML